ncbi:MAG: glycosyltransferase family 2 protein [Bacteroidetes bacterium]|nr:glycosyltransferase family 2 protein [Bacteroidota bacterium]
MISVIVPTYNYGRFIGECLDSLLQQTYANWECLVMDNASVDNTESIVRDYANHDARIRYHKLPENKGPSFARNQALKEAKGEYILFLDADDLIAPEKLKHTMDIFEKQNVDFVFSDYCFFTESREYITKTYSFSEKQIKPGVIGSAEIRNRLVYGNIFAISCIISRKKNLEHLAWFDEVIRYNEDWDLWLRASFADTSYYYDQQPDSVTLIRNHMTSHSKDQFGMYIAGLYVCLKNYKALSKAQQKIFDRKIRTHRYTLKKKLIDRYFNNRERFDESLVIMDQMPGFENELRSYRRKKWIMPRSLESLYLLFLKMNYRIAQKCL